MILAVCANPSVDSFWSFDQIKKGTTNRSRGESFYPGGKGIHVALALRELGQQVTTLGVWGGQTGEWLKDVCKKQNIGTAGPVVAEWTRICITNRTSNSWNETELLGAGPRLTPKQVKQFFTTYQSQIAGEPPEAIVLSGSAASGFEDDLYKKMIRTARKADIPTYVDASGTLLREALEVSPFAVHINRHEGKALSGQEDPTAIAHWLSQFCSVAAVTAGADGLFLLVEEILYHASHKLPPSDIISTVGAGDCLLAGLCLASLHDEDPRNWARYAVACGSANCIHPELGMLKTHDVEHILSNVTIEILDKS